MLRQAQHKYAIASQWHSGRARSLRVQSLLSVHGPLGCARGKFTGKTRRKRTFSQQNGAKQQALPAARCTFRGYLRNTNSG